MNFSEFEEFGEVHDPEGWDEICIRKDEYETAKLLQGAGFVCSRPMDKEYQHYLDIDLTKANPSTRPPDEVIQRFSDEWLKTIGSQKAEVYARYATASGWREICRFVGKMKAAIVGNASRRRREVTGRFLYPEKGLYFYGLPGRLKTTVAKEIADFLKIPFYSILDIEQGWVEHGDGLRKNETFKGLWRGPCVIDDLGSETKEAAQFKTFNFAGLVKHRMDILDSHKTVTIIAGNLPPGDFGTGDSRAQSNIVGMCTPVLFNGGPDMRQRPVSRN